jgi:peptidoglycan/xylan/chitin deacetylase (PgdA/CDA1 family)
MRILAIVVLILTTQLSSGQKKKVFFSFDDLPVVSNGTTDTVFQKELIDKLIRSLISNKIPAIGFVTEGKLFNNEGLITFQFDLLSNWVNNGLDLGNHTYSHPDYNTTSLCAYSNDILKGETISAKILKAKNKSLRYFRHPFLHVGNPKAKADSLSAFLLSNGYTVAPVTIDNEDYLFALAYIRAKVKNDSDLMLQIGNDYIAYMERKLLYYEKQGNILFGRDISQILLLHASSLNSDYVDSLATMFRRNNYDFVSLDKALEDDAFKSEVTVYGNWGISWIDKWALSRGKKGNFFKDEPQSPDYIRKLTEN